jgi:ectoine hydroxylase-related dioxygenase (phytanoyl-CoA dioxygenase family)
VTIVLQKAWQPLLAQNGATVIESVLLADEIDQLRHELEQHPLPRSRAGIRHALRHPAVNAVAHGESLLALARAVLGVEAFPYRATLFDKSAQSNWLVVWHQDRTLPLMREIKSDGWGPWSMKDGVLYAHAPAHALEQVVAIRLHLDDSTETNGPLRILPGTHTVGVVTDQAIERLSSSRAPSSLTASAGDVIAMRPLVVHSSQKAESSARRRVLHVEYSSTRHFDGLELAIT